MTQRPLSGIRILDSTVMTAGPWAVQILADLGAEVIKVERLGAPDVNRRLNPVENGTSYYYVCMNKDKKCIQFDYSKPAQKEAYLKLVEKCDVVTENFKAGSMDRQGLGFNDLRKVRPDLVYSAVSGYGQTGPCSPLPASDLVIQATCGFMSVNGDKGSTGMKAGSSLADVYASTVSAVAILGGILYKMETGEGVMVDTSMQNADMTTVAYELAKYLNTGEIDRPNGNADHEVGFADTVPTLNGDLVVQAVTDEQFRSFVRLLGLDALAEDARFGTAADRHDHAEELSEVISPVTAKWTREELVTACRREGVPVGEVFTMDQFMRSGYVEEQDLISIVHDAKGGDFRTLQFPLKFDKFEVPTRRATSQPGADTEEVLGDLLGMSAGEVRALYE